MKILPILRKYFAFSSRNSRLRSINVHLLSSNVVFCAGFSKIHSECALQRSNRGRNALSKVDKVCNINHIND
jgi:hypothetical protein